VLTYVAEAGFHGDAMEAAQPIPMAAKKCVDGAKCGYRRIRFPGYVLASAP